MLNYKNSIIIILLITVFTIFGLQKIFITNAPSSYIPNDLRSHILNDELIEKFNNDESIILVFDMSLTKEYLEKLSKLVSAIESIEYTRNVHSLFNYDSIYGSEDGFSIKHLVKHNELDSFSKDQFIKDVKHDRYIHDLTISKDLKLATILIEPKDLPESLKRIEFEKKIFEYIDQYDLRSTLHAFAGEFAVDTYQFKELDFITSKLIPITFGIGLVLIYLLFHSLSGVILAAMANGIVTVFVFSLFGHLNYAFNMIGSTIPTLMMALCIAFIVHLYNAITLRINENESFENIVKSSVAAIKKPTFYSSITTSAGLFSLTISTIPPIKSMGLIGGLGVLFVYLIVIYILPPLIVKFSTNNNWQENKYFKKWFELFLSKLSPIIEKRYKLIIAIITIGMISLAAFIFRIQSETNLYKFFQEDHPINLATDIVEEHFTAPTIFNISIKSEKELLQSDLLQRFDEFKVEALKLEEVDRVFSAADIIKQIHWAFNKEDESYFKIPEKTELIEQYLFIYDGEDLYNFISRDFNHHKIGMNLKVKGANQVEATEKKLKVLTDKYFNDDYYQVEFTGMGKLLSDQEDLIVETQLESLLISVFIIFLFMLVSWRNLKDSLICMIPNLSPIFSMFVIMGIFNIYLDMGTAIIASIIIGIAIDDTIHFYSLFKKNLAEGMDVFDAIKMGYEETGRAIIITTIILGVQFALMGFSGFMPLKYFGILTAIGVLSALIFDLILLPALLMFVYRKTQS